jgi:hypothetical protein
MSLFKLIAIRIVLLIALFPAMFTLSLGLRQGLMEVWGRFYFKYTYIEIIDTPSYGNYTKLILEEFNSYGNGKIISFDKIKNGRPVRIYEMTDFEENLRPQILGSAWPMFTDCNIRIKKRQDFIDYRETLLHEYLHCMGYDHVPDMYDLMYESMISVDKEENIRQYGKKVLEKFYE